MTRPLWYVQAAGVVRMQISDGTLLPGQPAPSGPSLARLTGFSTLTCRKALRVLVAQGILVAGASANARPRVAVPGGASGRDPVRAPSQALAGRRRAAGLTQPALAARTGYSVTTVGHAETGRVWQSCRFWERADAALDAGGELKRLHDAYRARATSLAGGPAPAPVPVPRPVSLVCLMMHWSDGTVTAVSPPAPATTAP